jgi:KilA-N domain
MRLMKKKTINVQGLSITIEQVKDSDYISLTDIAKVNADDPAYVIQNWMKNSNTIRYLYRWEEIHNPALNPIHLDDLLKTANDNRRIISPKMWIETVNAIGLQWKTGRGGGTLAHKDIALNFCYWLSPEFQIYLIKEFQRLKEEEFSKQSIEWHISRITDLVDETRNWLDTIPGQEPGRNRLNILKGNADEQQH